MLPKTAQQIPSFKEKEKNSSKNSPKFKQMKKPRLVIFFLLTAAAAAAAANRDTITTTTPLSDTDLLITADQTFALGFFTPPNSLNRYLGLWYYLIHEPTPSILWVANRNNPVVNSTATLSLLPSGNLIIANSSNITVWSSNSTTTSPIAKLLPTGNLVVLTSSSSSPTYAWQGYSYLTDTLIPNMHLGLDFADNINRTLVSWTSPSDPSPGSYNAYMDPRGDPEIFFNSPTSRIWRTGPWDGTHLSGIPDMVTYRGFNFSFADNPNEVSYFYTISNRTLVSRLIVNSTGVVQRAIWVWETGAWNYFWTAPKDQCDNIGYCGRFGVCDINNAPVCGCMQGFTPRNPANWNMYKYWKEGCVRKTELDCVNGTDGFVVVSNVKLPQSGNCSVDRSLGLGECRSLCLKNCSCTAYASADVSGGGSGCVIWVGELYDVRNYVGAGQDLYVRLANADLGTPPGKSAHSPATVAIVVSVVVGVLLLACVGCFMWRRKKSRRVNLGAPSFNDQSTHEGTVEGDLDLPLFDLGTISAATDNFSVVNKLGEGGFGPVYKGMLGEGQEIAVKRLAKTSTQGIDEFKNEVMLIAKLQHRNLVRLVGCCIQRDERMLIYEYMSNTSLDAFLFEEGRGALLDWKTRHQIILGIARGLLYLHQDSIVRIIHRDLKVSNILLDKDMNPKISDFGMARIFGGDESDFNTRKVVGTYGYMSPEYAMDGVFSVKSDVFSFGVLVLEIISGKKNRGVYAVAPHTNLVAHAWSLWKEGKSLQLVDESMNYSFPMDEVLRCIKTGLLCVQEQPEDRPLMSTVLLMLGSDISSLPQPKQPGFAARRGPLEAYTSSSYQDSSTLNSISGTMVEGR